MNTQHDPTPSRDVTPSRPTWQVMALFAVIIAAVAGVIFLLTRSSSPTAKPSSQPASSQPAAPSPQDDASTGAPQPQVTQETVLPGAGAVAPSDPEEGLDSTQKGAYAAAMTFASAWLNKDGGQQQWLVRLAPLTTSNAYSQLAKQGVAKVPDAHPKGKPIVMSGDPTNGYPVIVPLDKNALGLTLIQDPSGHYRVSDLRVAPANATTFDAMWG